MSIMKTKNKTIYTNNFTNEDYKINLLPDRLHYISLSRNLPQYTWNKFRRIHIESKNGTCELCGLKMNSYHNCHEIFEVYDDTVKLVGIKVLCYKCHMTQHIGFVSLGKAKVSFEELKDHYGEISCKDFEAERNKAMQLYNKMNSILKDKELKFDIDEKLLGRDIVEKYKDSIEKLIR